MHHAHIFVGSQCKLAIIQDVSMCMFIEKAIHGRISFCCGSFLVPKTLNVKTRQSRPKYLDLNNLYGIAKRKPSPCDDLKWTENEENFNVNAFSDGIPEEYILQADLECPKRLYNTDVDFPCHPECGVPIGANLSKLQV